MDYPSINIQGNIISSEILDKIRNEDIKYQQAGDFGLDRKTSVRDEIGIAWSVARAHWSAFKIRRDRLKEGESGTAETRNSWMIALLKELGYEVERATAYVHPDTHKTYAISHKAANLGDFPIHIMGINDDLDKRRETSGPRLSPHALTQEYLNTTDHVYALVSNGRYLRLLRDATRLVRLSYLEINLEKMMEEELYADFAIFFRLMHATRMPLNADQTEDSFIEFYHQESLASGSRIREKLSEAVEKSIKALANGFLEHPINQTLTKEIDGGYLKPETYYNYQLRLIYRLLFLIVTEERNLVYPVMSPTQPPPIGRGDFSRMRKIYYNHYSIERLRRLAGKFYFVDGRKQDLWEGLLTTFRIFEDGAYGEKLGIKPLGSGIFSNDALGLLNESKLSNAILLEVIKNLTFFENSHGQLVRVNYSDLDVEEFGSVYEGLLEYDATFIQVDGRVRFEFTKGEGRSRSGAHYTPEELVKPLIRHSLDYIIEEKLKEEDQEKALLSIKVCDVAAGSGHILLSAARRIALELARVRSHEDQPAPPVFRNAIRDVIRNCIYGVDKNPLAVELCKVALWLESHNPGEPLNFLDHRIKCGDSIVGLVSQDELKNGIANKAFKTLPGDDKTIAAALLKRNKKERATPEQLPLDFEGHVGRRIKSVLSSFEEFARLPERTPAEIETKEKAYRSLTSGSNWYNLRIMADMMIAPFFIAKTNENEKLIATDAIYRDFLRGMPLQGQIPAKAQAISVEKTFFHWFLEFPDVFAKGGFDCVLGNPPFLGGQKLSGSYGDDYLQWLRTNYQPAGAVDLVTYFFRRIFTILKPAGFQSLIATNTIAQGGAREGGLDVIQKEGGTINHAIKSMKWPGLAAVEVSLVSIHKGDWKGPFFLNQKPVARITTYLDDSETEGHPYPLKQNEGKSFQGSIVLGKGFILKPEEAEALIRKDPKNKDVLFPYLNGDDLNNNPDQSPSRWVINFFDWPLMRYIYEDWENIDKDIRDTIRRHLREGKFEPIAPPDYEKPIAMDFEDCIKLLENTVKLERERTILMKNQKGENPTTENITSSNLWWLFHRPKLEYYNSIIDNYVNVIALTSKTVAIASVSKDQVFSHSLGVFIGPQYFYFGLLQSFVHNNWALKYASSMKSDLRYTPTACFETFPFPVKFEEIIRKKIESIGETCHEHRRQLMLKSQLGLTKTYNLFHSKELRPLTAIEELLDEKPFEKQFGKEAAHLRKHLIKTPGTISFNEAVAGIIKLRELHVVMDQAVLEAYGWQDIKLRHDFYEVDYLPENDRVRYTIHPDARQAVLKRLLQLNHKIHEEEVAAGLWDKKGGSKKSKKSIYETGSFEEPEEGYGGLFNQ